MDKRFYPNEIGTWKVKWVAKALANPIFSIGISIVFIVTPWLSVVLSLNIFEKYELKWLFITVLGVSVLTTLFLPYFLRAARFKIIKSEVIKAMSRLPLDENTCIIGAGGGSFFLIGMILKEWQEKKKTTPPSAICISLSVDNREREFYPSLNQVQNIIDKNKVLIVLSAIGTGKGASKMLEWANAITTLEKVTMFSLIVSEDAANTGEWKDIYTLGVLNRSELKKSIIPWIKTLPNKIEH